MDVVEGGAKPWTAPAKRQTTVVRTVFMMNFDTSIRTGVRKNESDERYPMYVLCVVGVVWWLILRVDLFSSMMTVSAPCRKVIEPPRGTAS
jgi:hypothetical protein